MLEAVRTFWGKLRGRGKVIAEKGQLWRCTKCGLIFLTYSAGEQHDCKEKL